MAQQSWQVTVTTAGTAVQGPNTGSGQFLVVRHPGNTGTYAYFGNDGNDDVSSTTGFVLGDLMIVVTTSNMNKYYIDADSDGDKVCIIRSLGLPPVVAP